MPKSRDKRNSPLSLPLSGMDSPAGEMQTSVSMDVKVEPMPSQERREQLRAWLDAGLRQKDKSGVELAALLGTTPSRVSEMRKGRRGIKGEELAIIAQYIGREPPDVAGKISVDVISRDLPPQREPLNMLKVVGVAEAGAFRQQDMLTQVAEAFIEVPRSEAYPLASHYALLVRGDSMDQRGILDGDHVSVVDYSDIGSPLKNGTIVHVQRSEDGGYIEWTLKEIHTFKDRYELRPRSSNPSHKSVFIPREGSSEAGNQEIRVMGIVVGLHRSLDF